MIGKLIEQYDLPAITSVSSLGNAGGFSGSGIWKLETSENSLCAKAWPKSFSDEERIAWIHRVTIFAKANGCPEVAAPLTNRLGQTYCRIDGRYWELTQWIDGDSFANFEGTEKWESSMDTIARFHQATARFYFNFDVSENAQTALARLRNFKFESTKIAKDFFPTRYCSKQQLSDFLKIGSRLASNILKRFEPLENQTFAVQPVIRDLRSEHFYFDGNTVNGLIDFGAMKIDSIGCDLARLLNDLTGPETQQIHSILEQYSKSRPLNENEFRLVQFLQHASALIGVTNWLSWLYIDRRQFECETQVQERIARQFDRFYQKSRDLS